MKKILALILALLLMISVFASCEQYYGEDDWDDDEDYEEDEDNEDDEDEDRETGKTTRPTVESYPEPGTKPGTDETVFVDCDEIVYVVDAVGGLALRTATDFDDSSNVMYLVSNGTELRRIGISENGEWSKVVYEGMSLYADSEYISTQNPNYEPEEKEDRYSVSAYFVMIDNNDREIFDGKTYEYKSDSLEPTVYNFFENYASHSENNFGYTLRGDGMISKIGILKDGAEYFYEATGEMDPPNYEEYNICRWQWYINGNIVEDTTTTLVEDGDLVELRYICTPYGETPGYTFVDCSAIAYVSAESAYYRSEPAVFDYTVKGTLSYGDEVTVTGISYDGQGWSRIEMDGNTYYINTGALSDEKQDETIVFTDCEETVYTLEVIRLLITPDENNAYNNFVVVGKGDALTRTGIAYDADGSDGWSRINYFGTICYARNSVLTTEEFN